MVSKKRPSKKRRLAEYLELKKPAAVAETEWRELLALLAPVTPGYLRRLLRASGVRLAPLVEGIRQDSFEDLERTLRAMTEVYELALAAADRETAKRCRALVIEAKDHARLSMRRHATGDTQRWLEKKEMEVWLLTWLENPGVFPLWVELRKRSHPRPDHEPVY